MLPVGLHDSSFATTLPEPAGMIFRSWTRGVLPIAAIMSGASVNMGPCSSELRGSDRLCDRRCDESQNMAITEGCQAESRALRCLRDGGGGLRARPCRNLARWSR